MNTKEIINFYLENNILISPELLEQITNDNKIIPIDSKFIVINEDILEIINSKTSINIIDYELSLLMKEKYNNIKLYNKFREYIYQNKNKIEKSKDKDLNSETKIINKNEKSKDKPDASENINLENNKINSVEETTTNDEEQKKTREIENGYTVEDILVLDFDKLQEYKNKFLEKHDVKILSNYTVKSRKRTVADFVGYFNSRFKEIEKILRVRQELQGLTSISRILAKKEKEQVSLIGIVYEKNTTKNGNTLLTIEDTTGVIKVVVSKNKEELHNLVQEIQLDEIIGVTGTYDGIVFVNNLLIPDIPLTKELKKSPEEGYFLLISDPQLGNKLFLEKEFEKLISWINGEVGSDIQREIASKIKYIFIVGDLVDGVGIYPGQEYDLKIIDINDQYQAFANYLKRLPNIPIFVCPGNHDVGRISEPQPGFKDEYSKPVWSLPNVIPVSNPSLINIYAQPEQNFDGFDILLYHGYSFFYYFGHVPTIRQKGGPKRSDLVMKYLLQRRHLAPTHASSLYIPDPKKDPLVIDKIPDFFFTGHVHRATVNNYRNITCINASCWVSKSEEQERRGIEPQPARAFIINMQTREVKVMNFLSKEEQEKEIVGEQNG